MVRFSNPGLPPMAGRKEIVQLERYDGKLYILDLLYLSLETVEMKPDK
jgi:hypothetical protein